MDDSNFEDEIRRVIYDKLRNCPSYATVDAAADEIAALARQWADEQYRQGVLDGGAEECGRASW